MTIGAGDNNTRHPQNIRSSGGIAGGAAGNHTITGIGARDILTSVIATTEGDITAECTITAADTINNTGGSDTTGEELTVMWYAQP